ncbi:hypothetical protein MGAD_14960 [Mycolicibacterium gadium]|uniref:Uncharacterized protein n=1 Tax=Mycolicibacterium gadium TaxID=1794 RepID=A0A7I7WKT6_MYCGU|nr:hypothetical protein MGAD_14960 [Mycolicibacterium gadium]
MSVTYIRVRTTSAKEAPASCKAISMRRNASRACAATLSPAPVVPATATNGPVRTAREYPTVASYSEPEETLRRVITHKVVAPVAQARVYSRAID